MAKALPIMFQGTHSDAGKSIIATAFCRIFAENGWKTAPFKSQNMSLNSYVTVDGKEIGRAQGIQAEAAGIVATTDMNPILIKPSREHESQIIVHGRPYKNMRAFAYRNEFFEKGLSIIRKSLDVLMNEYDRLVIEGAGSPAEINLNDRELVNMRVARMANAPVILVGDIERGGVFASLVGTLQLLDQEDRKRIIGVIINKFRGDLALLQPGLDWFEQYTGVPVLGVVPYLEDLHIDAEDSVSLEQMSTAVNPDKDIDIAVIRYPKISNFTDVDPFLAEPDCHVRLVTTAAQLGKPDLLILPGSKNTIEDLLYMKKQGIAEQILTLYKHHSATIVGICGGYQMLGARIRDPFGVETPLKEISGLHLLPLETTLERKKTTVLSEGILTFAGERFLVKGYEIHMGRSQPLDGDYIPFIDVQGRGEGAKSKDDRVLGTYFHDLFHNDAFREALLNNIRRRKGLAPIYGRQSFRTIREQAFDRLANHVKRHVRMDEIEEKMHVFQKEDV
ncbi:cobyric acid synthase [Parageobacillus thermoglucosidasius]|uniref:Cobyric acid synthase n=2 Tax=Anoxybacillaceae TaxID=3120669 RepID=A0AAN0YQI5_PARTM|nr:cobyric acid synthase [Parageobacillus thermoglucosidasius]ALF10666.1 cobalamin biosynthesis protein CobQ [Parageobacillus thermoglucosidasius]ANZ30744.1 cobyric acid synthase CobQ [Parageobacillus thermoglucosidasius]APM81482.1 cobyric acid synthase CobQ [Parageobacillus thermoglucosidasius]KJX69316.1 cobalamin biosynthesis protein CobQ [Parageobacillus thermoglucosidasius]MBY6268893.1 cobyric acid synthase [Parageobacillus thermoglucosidasius]